MGYWPRATLSYGIDLPRFNAADNSWYHQDAPEEAGSALIRESLPANTCGVIERPDGGYRVVARYYSADGGRGARPERISGEALMPPDSAVNDLLEALKLLLGVEKLTDLAGVEPDWVLSAATI
jgi:hypothetical protein